MQRFYEILPGSLTWATIILMVVASWKLPIAAAVFIILFDTYFLLKAVYLSFHLRAAFNAMKRNLKTDWIAELNEVGTAGENNLETLGMSSWRDLYHLIVLPMSTEPYEVLRDTFASLAAADYPRDRLFVVLSTEERLGDGPYEMAQKIQEEFGGSFAHLLLTQHPAGIPGELPGKGSNETWAAQQAKAQLLDPMGLDPRSVLVSVFDVDTQVPAGYFARLAHAYLTAPSPLRAIYQPIPLFTNNIYQAPALARVISFSTTFWQMMQQSRPERLTSFSSQSLPFQVLLDIGYWHVDVVSEDSRIFWQCLLNYHGNFRVEPLAYPVSMDANAAPKFWRTLKNLYKQQRRWAWGAENVPYILGGFAKDRIMTRRDKWYWGFNTVEGYHSWATNSLIIFALGWLPVMLGGHDFKQMLLAYSLPKVTRFIVGLSMVGVMTSAIMGIVLLPPKPEWFRLRHAVWYFFQWVLLPITLIIFGSVPAIDAQTRLMLGGRFRLGFWVTPKGR